MAIFSKKRKTENETNTKSAINNKKPASLLDDLYIYLSGASGDMRA